ncbi:ACP S-malonyltransferase [Lacticaseibacillus manihotivorans]|uniref:[acyl-carrier-protein] S-malonyltransferase n=1 Tax=Lacticaseibacillus manihotivorans TaxID=88233 RepID=A0A5P8JNG9_9LACO|nr:acyltransferase domain-containing protein [Lacticaseibacillus manihotivorans]QFQ90648.1 acyltransferase domain-containing protein [Lacticaseibacillus manihotivorans]
MRSLWIFPGQGGQHAGMLKDVDPALREHVEQMLDLKLLDTDVAYQDSVQLQVGIELLQVSQINSLKASGLKPSLVAGHSLGVFAAAYAIGSLQQDDLFPLVKRRAELMQGAYPEGYGMGVVVGMSRKQVEDLVAQVHSDEHPVYASNQNSEDQTALSGELAAIDQVVKLAKDHGATIAMRLKVPVPSHSPLMADVATKLSALLESVPLTKPNGIYLANNTGHAVRQVPQVEADLSGNLAHPVYFEAMMAVAHDYQPDSIVNFSPGRPFRKVLGQKFGDLHQVNLDQMSVSDVEFLLNKWERGTN